MKLHQLDGHIPAYQKVKLLEMGKVIATGTVKELIDKGVFIPSYNCPEKFFGKKTLGLIRTEGDVLEINVYDR